MPSGDSSNSRRSSYSLRGSKGSWWNRATDLSTSRNVNLVFFALFLSGVNCVFCVSQDLFSEQQCFRVLLIFFIVNAYFWPLFIFCSG